MTTGAKVAIGCAAVALVGIIVVTVGVGGAAWWAKSKVEQAAGDQDRIEQLHEQANQNEFRRPSDGVIAEAQLQKFLDVRRRVYDVYKKYEKDIEARGKKEQADIGDVATAFGMINEIRLAQAQAQADVGMSDDEYGYLVEQVYKTMWAAEVAKSTGGKSISEAAAEAYDQAAQAMAQAAEQAKQARESAERSGDDAAEEVAEESEEDVEEGMQDLRKQAEEARERAKEMDVPPANIELFRKYEAQIKQYAMSGLEWIGL
ncbi:MAG TPA: hypothetical protein VJ874_04310 [Candidatus Thermoplasmatota archaeon]|nr:hypothetical protein [Candidatus Thermoplasmatota archaeon]